MTIWAAGVWADGVWADGVWEGDVPGSGSGDGDVDDSEQYGGSMVMTIIRCFPLRVRALGARKGKPYSTNPDLDYEL